jgi:hypothetical protein
VQLFLRVFASRIKKVVVECHPASGGCKDRRVSPLCVDLAWSATVSEMDAICRAVSRRTLGTMHCAAHRSIVIHLLGRFFVTRHRCS